MSPYTCRRLYDAEGRLIGTARVQVGYCERRDCRRPVAKLCDGKVAPGRTCDRQLCEVHAVHVGPNEDLCLDCSTRRLEAKEAAG